ncbi:MAG: TolC family protein, partial [Planctomycetota bacterium]
MPKGTSVGGQRGAARNAGRTRPGAELHSAARFTVLGAIAVAVIAGGCSPRRARLAADRDAYHLIDQKTGVSEGDVGRYRIGVRPESRMHDPSDPDCPPMPPDDPKSHRYLECVDGKRGAKRWREAPRTPFVENPGWRATLPLDAEGRLVLDTAAAVRLGLVNDPDFQQELEELYLSALDVSFERFRFDTQLFGGVGVDAVAEGRDRTGTGDSSSELFVSPSSRTLGPTTPNRWRLQRLTATGGEMVVGLANSLVWQFAGPNDYSGATLLDFSIVQPLLRGGGRVRVMERLTVAERTLLANVRAMERFRREYYLNVTTGRFPGGGPQRRGGILGGAGLANFAGVGLRIGGGGGGGGGFGGGGGAGAAAAGGYLGLLQTQQVLANQRSNVADLRESTRQLEASYDAGRIDRFQVDLARQALFNAQSQLLRAEADYETTLDNFKVDLGLPPDLELLVSDPVLERFNLRGGDLTDLQNRAAAAALARIDAEVAPAVEPEVLPEPVAEEVPVAGDTAALEQLLAGAIEQLAVVERDVAALVRVAPARRGHLREIGARREVRDTRIDPAIFDADRFDERVAGVQRDLGAWRSRLADLEADAEGEESERLEGRLSSLLLELSILQARARLDAIDLRPTELTPAEALEIARVNRRDWANARASLVDAWRLIAFNANDLRSGVDLVFSGDVSNVGQNPFDLRASNGRLRVGVEFDSPTSRLAERNVYRQSLIEYQQARRSYYRFVDRVHQGLRNTLRQVRLNEINLELRREAVFVAIAQVDLTQLRLSEPPKPGETEQFNNTTARDLVQALGDLLQAQNDLLSVWVNNRVQRLGLELDLGVMLVDSEGLRVEQDTPLRTLLPVDGCGGGDVELVTP